MQSRNRKNDQKRDLEIVKICQRSLWQYWCINQSWDCVRGHPFRPLPAKFRCHAPLSDVGPAPHVTLQPRTISRVPRTSPHYVALTYILCSYVPRSRLCLTADMVA